MIGTEKVAGAMPTKELIKNHNIQEFFVSPTSYFTLKDFNAYDWDIEVNPEKQKEIDEFDIIIVGSGLGGLSCGAVLSNRGYKVLVLEQHSRVGGFCSSFKRNGFIFNVGLGRVTGLEEKGPIHYLCTNIGLKKDDYFVKYPTGVRFLYKGIDAHLSDTQSIKDLLSDLYPDENRNITTFFDDSEKAHDEFLKYADIYGVPLPKELILKAFGEEDLRKYEKECPHYIDWANKTIKQKLDEHFKNEKLKALINDFLNYHGTKPTETAAFVILRSLGFYRYGNYYSKGGAQRFVNSLKDFIKSRGGTFLVKHKVDKILIEKKIVKGVQVGEKIFRSPVVVSNANAKATFLRLIDPKNLDDFFVDYAKGIRISSSGFIVFLGVDMDLSDYPVLTKNKDEGYQILIASNVDRSSAPEGKASVRIWSAANYDDYPQRGTPSYLQKKKELSEMLIKMAEKLISGLSNHILVQDAATPKTIERYTLMPEGSLEGLEETIENRKPCFKTPVKGLYLAGSSTYPGGGIELVIMSGLICANDICKWQVDTK